MLPAHSISPIRSPGFVDRSRPGVYGYGDLDDTTWVRVDSLGRARKIKGESEHWLLPPNYHSRNPHPAYQLGHEWAVSYEYQMLLTNIFRYAPRTQDFYNQDGALVYPRADASFLSYAGMVNYYSSIHKSAREINPRLLTELTPLAVNVNPKGTHSHQWSYPALVDTWRSVIALLALV